MIAADFLNLLRCPRTGLTLSLADAALLSRVGEQTPPVVEALVSADGRWLYPVRDGIPLLLAEEAITL